MRKDLAKYSYEMEAFERMQRTFFADNPIKIALADVVPLALGQDCRYVYFAARVIVPISRKWFGCPSSMAVDPARVEPRRDVP